VVGLGLHWLQLQLPKAVVVVVVDAMLKEDIWPVIFLPQKV
jgi:hypothetical protein